MVQVGKTKRIFDGRFEILGIVGRGSQSVVYHARNALSPDTHVALKVLVNNQGKTQSPSSLGEKLRKEALAMVAARHRYVVRIEDFHSIDTLCYLSMEYAPEGDLRKYVSSRLGKLAPAQAERFFKQSLEALCAVHKSGIIHRDIKPDNILVINDRETRLADFGVALLPGDDSSIEELQKGVGTFSYMAPEVLEGKEYKESADLYSLAVTFYELLSGSHPFDGANLIDQLKIRQDGNIKPISKVVSDISPKLAQTIMHCLAYRKEDRPRSSEELLEFLSSTEKMPTGTQTKTPEKIPTPQKPEQATERTTERAAERPAERPTPTRTFVSGRPGEATQAPIQPPTLMASPTQPPTPPTSLSTPLPAPPPIVRQEEPIRISAPNLLKVERKPVVKPKEIIEEPIKEPAPIERQDVQSDQSVEDAVNEILSAKSKLKFEDLSLPPKKRIPGAAIFAILMLFAIYYRFSGTENSYDNTSPKARLTSGDDPTAVEKSPSTSEPLMPKAGSTDSLFPLLGAGIYHGEVHGLYPDTKHSLTFISFPDKERIAVIVGMEGWTPAVISTSELKPGDVLKVASNGFVLQLTGKKLEDGEFVGYFKNLVVGEQGEWRVKLLGGSK